jgi:hypothetical protein
LEMTQESHPDSIHAREELAVQTFQIKEAEEDSTIFASSLRALQSSNHLYQPELQASVSQPSSTKTRFCWGGYAIIRFKCVGLVKFPTAEWVTFVGLWAVTT